MVTAGRARVAQPMARSAAWLAVVLLGLTLATGVVALATKPDAAPAATWWPAAGIAVALLGLTPRRWWWGLVPAVAGTTAAANLIGGRDLDLAAWFGVANALEALVVAALLRRGRRRLPDLATFEALFRLALFAALGGVVFATIAGAGVTVLTGAGYHSTWRALAISHAASIFVIVPLAMVPWRRPTRGRVWELALQATALAAVTTLVFSAHQTLSLDFLPLPILLWAALRFDLGIVVVELLGFAFVTTIGSSMGAGPFGFDYERGELSAIALGAVVQAYIIVAAAMSLPLAIGLEQRRSTEQLFRRNFTESVVGMLLMRSATGRALVVTEMNDAAAGILGDPEAVLGRRLPEILRADESLERCADRMLAGDLDGWKAACGLRDRPEVRVEVAVSLLSTEPEPTFAAQLLDVTAEYDARRRLEAAEKLTSATLDTAAAMILVTDLTGVVVRVNGATTALTGFSEDELVGVEVWDLPFAPPGAVGYPAGLPDHAGAHVGRESDVVTRSGERRRIQWNTGYVNDERNRPTHVVLTGSDLTAERRTAGLNRHLLEAAITTALIGIDPQGRITLFNAGAVNLLGYDGQGTVGRPFTDLFDPEELAERCGATGEEAFERMVAGTAGDQTTSGDWTWIGADGRRHTVSMTLSVAADTFAARFGYLCVGRDVTEARASQEMLITALDKERLAVQRMRELDAAKNVFVSTVSHELRTPVTSIVGYTEILEDGTVVKPAPEQLPLLSSIARNGRRLILLCDDLLTLSGLDSGATRWERGEVDLTAIVPGAEDSMRAQIAGRDLELVLSTSDQPVPVLGDQGQLERVLTNLLSNAVKFTEDGGRIEVTVTAADGEACLSVCDTGIGIPESEQDGLFQRFFRSTTAQQRAIQGTGLGLSIVAAIVAAHGGRIDVRSAHLAGTTVTVRLPLAR